MKKLLFMLVFALASLQASTGTEIYIQKCSVCHAMQGMMNQKEKQSMMLKMKSATPEEKMAMRKTMMEKMKKSDMKAPPMPMVSMRLKKMTNSKEEFVAFVKDYIQNPSKKKGFCMPMAYKRFGTMPPIGKTMSAKERETVANWLYNNFHSSWKNSMSGKMCDMKNKQMKCGSGKCGGAMKKSSSKCGAVKIETH